MGWRDLSGHFNQLMPARGLGGPRFHWNKIAARHLDFLRPLHLEGALKSKEVVDKKVESAVMEDDKEDEQEDWVLVER
jgi:hypothetical protein